MKKQDDLWYDLSQMFVKHQNVGGVRVALQKQVRDYIVFRLKQERLRTLEEAMKIVEQRRLARKPVDEILEALISKLKEEV